MCACLHHSRRSAPFSFPSSQPNTTFCNRPAEAHSPSRFNAQKCTRIQMKLLRIRRYRANMMLSVVIPAFRLFSVLIIIYSMCSRSCFMYSLKLEYLLRDIEVDFWFSSVCVWVCIYCQNSDLPARTQVAGSYMPCVWLHCVNTTQQHTKYNNFSVRSLCVCVCSAADASV